MEATVSDDDEMPARVLTAEERLREENADLVQMAQDYQQQLQQQEQQREFDHNAHVLVQQQLRADLRVVNAQLATVREIHAELLRIMLGDPK